MLRVSSIRNPGKRFRLRVGIPSYEMLISRERQREVLYGKSEAVWRALNTEDKLNVLQCVANIEANYLGISTELNVGDENLPEHTLTHYSDVSHTICIDLNHLENDPASKVLNSCCHEAYNGYQYRLVDAYNESSKDVQKLCIFRNVVCYADEFDTYVDGNEDFYSYYTQQCEEDARTYAENAVDDYYSRIAGYLAGDFD